VILNVSDHNLSQPYTPPITPDAAQLDYEAELETILFNETLVAAINDSSILEPRREAIDAFTFPYGPIFLQFHQDVENGIKRAFLEVLYLAYHASVAASCPTPEFNRYFNPEDQPRVFNMFRNILGPINSGPPEMANPQWPFVIFYGNQPTAGDGDMCQANPSLNGYMSSYRTDRVP
jgi:hypothetical protein